MNRHLLRRHTDRHGDTWECTCGLFSVRRDHGWTTQDHRTRPVPAPHPTTVLRRFLAHRRGER